MDQLTATLASVTIVSLISLVGVIFIGLRETLLKRVLMLLVGFSSGTLIGSAFLGLLPEALSETSDVLTVFSYVVLGIVTFFALEKFLYWRHCHEGECPVHMFAYLNIIGDGIHNFIDGMVIAASFSISLSLGFGVTLAVVFHEIPQEIGDFGVQIYGGLSKKKALFFNFASALTAIVGAVVTYFLAYTHALVPLLIPFAAGGFIYVAATDLMPELHKKSRAGESITQLVSMIIGLVLMAYFAFNLSA